MGFEIYLGFGVWDLEFRKPVRLSISTSFQMDQGVSEGVGVGVGVEVGVGV